LGWKKLLANILAEINVAAASTMPEGGEKKRNGKNGMPQTDMIGGGIEANARPFIAVSSSFFLLFTSMDKTGGLDRSQARPHSKAPIYPPGRNRNPRNIERAHRICNAVGMPYNRYQLYCSARHCLALRASDRTSPRLIQDLPCHRHPHGHGIAPPAIHRALHTKSDPVLRHEKLGGEK